MALFHDTCNAIIDRNTGNALTGEALEAARSILHGVDDKGNAIVLSRKEAENQLAARGWGFCGNRVPKKARNCNKCGTGAPRGWVKCPACGKWVGNDSRYCPNCNHPLHPDERVDIAGGVWDRSPGVFAQRFECGEDERLMKNGIKVQEGSVAIVLDGGRNVKTLGPGRHVPEGTLRSINWFGNPPPRSIVLVASGDLIFTVSFPGLRSAEELPLSASADITLRFEPGKAAAFLENFLKERRTVSADAVCEWIMSEASSTVKDFALQSTIEDLVKDPERRPRLEEALSRTLSPLVSRNGFSLVRVGAVEFEGPDYSRMRERYGALDKARRELEFKKANLELISSEEQIDISDAKARDERAAADARDRAGREEDDKKFYAAKEKETADYLKQLAQEKQLSDIDDWEEVQLALRVSSGRLSRKDAELEAAARLERDARETETLAHKLNLDLQLRDYHRDALLKDARAAAAVEAVKRSEMEAQARTRATIDGIEMDSWAKRASTISKSHKEWLEMIAAGQDAVNRTNAENLLRLLEVKARNEKIKSESERARAETVKGLGAKELAALSGGDAAAAQRFIELAKLEIMAGLSPEQILAIGVSNGQNAKDAASAFAAAKNAESAVAAAEANAKTSASDAVAQELRTYKDELRQDLAAMRQHDEKLFVSAAGVANTAASRPTPPPPPPVVQPTQQFIK